MRVSYKLSKEYLNIIIALVKKDRKDANNHYEAIANSLGRIEGQLEIK